MSSQVTPAISETPEITEGFYNLGEGLANYCDPPSVEDIQKWLNDPSLTLRATEREFLQNLASFACVNPEIVRLAMSVRVACNLDLPLTQEQAETVLCQLGMKDFPLTGLNISGLQLPFVNLQNSVIGQDFVMKRTCVTMNVDQTNAIIGGDVDQWRAIIGGDVDQWQARIGGSLNQSFAKIDGNLEQDGAEIDGNLKQAGVRISGDLNQGGVRIGGYLYQACAEIGRNLNQRSTMIGKYSDQWGVKIGRDLNQGDIRIGGNLNQIDAQIGGDVNQIGARIGGESIIQQPSWLKSLAQALFKFLKDF